MTNIEHLIENGLSALSEGQNFDEMMDKFPNTEMLESVNMTKEELREECNRNKIKEQELENMKKTL